MILAILRIGGPESKVEETDSAEMEGDAPPFVFLQYFSYKAFLIYVYFKNLSPERSIIHHSLYSIH